MDWHKAWQSAGPSDKLASIRHIKEGRLAGSAEQQNNIYSGATWKVSCASSIAYATLRVIPLSSRVTGAA